PADFARVTGHPVLSVQKSGSRKRSAASWRSRPDLLEPRFRITSECRPSDRWPDKRRPLVANTVTDVTRLCEKAVLATSRRQLGSVRVARDPTEGTLAGRGIGESNRRQVPTP